MSASRDETLKVWDTATGDLRRTLAGHAHWVTGCAIDPSGTRIVSSSRDRTLVKWDAATGTGTLIAEASNELRGCALDPDGAWVIAAGDTDLMRWGVPGPNDMQRVWSLNGSLRACEVSRDGRRIVSAGTETVVFDPTTEDTLRPTARIGLSQCCAIEPGGDWVVSGDDVNSLAVWDLSTGAGLRTFTGHRDTVGILDCHGTGLSGREHKRHLIRRITFKQIRKIEPVIRMPGNHGIMRFKAFRVLCLGFPHHGLFKTVRPIDVGLHLPRHPVPQSSLAARVVEPHVCVGNGIALLIHHLTAHI